MKKLSTKKALLFSALAMVLCVSMLVGTTFAWFTDTASTSVNKIQAGNLDVALEVATAWDEDGNPTEWENAEGQTLNFIKAEGHESEAILWEPGCTYKLPELRIVNNGNLALKYNAYLGFANATENANGKTLADVLTMSINDWVNTSDNPALEDAEFEGILLPGKDEEISISLTWNPTANDNDYMGLSIEGAAITVYATQYTYEYDSNGNQYDEGATQFVATAAQFEAALASSATEIVIVSDITYDWGRNSYTSANNLAMSGKTFIGATGNETITFKGYGSANNIKDVTLKNIKVADETNGDNENSWEHGYLEFEDLTAENVVFVDGIQLNGTCNLKNCTFTGKDLENYTPTFTMYAAWVNSGNSTFTNCKFIGTRGLKTHEAYSSDVTSITVDNCTFAVSDKPGVVIGTLDSTTSVTIKNSLFAGCAAGDQSQYIYESDTGVTTFNFTETNNEIVNLTSDDTALNTAITDGNATIYLGSGDFIIPDSAKNKTLKIVGIGDANVAVQNDNSYEQCDYSFDGSNVTFENVTITTDSHTYAGYARLSAIYNNCTFNGTYTLYDTSVFNNCTFNVSGDKYNVWTWGATSVEFNNCTFNSSGKSVLLYGGNSAVLTAKDCIFNDDNAYADVNNKAAIETGCDWKSKGYVKEIIAENCTVNGFDITNKGTNTNSKLWGNKDELSTDALKVTIDGVRVY